MRKYAAWVLLPAIWVLWIFNRPAKALPTMVRLGYTNCAVCHISPQGGGLLNAYGRSIDEAQSLRGGDYQPSTSRFVRWLDWGDHITQDVRSVTQGQLSTATDEPLIGTVRARFMYRNATELGKGWRLSAVINGENRSSKRPNLSYEPPIEPKEVYLSSALLSYRPKSTLEFSVGRDQLPNGVNNPDLTTYIRTRNLYGYYDAPLQFKIFWWGKHYQISPYAFGPGGTEPTSARESGGGSLAEFSLLGKHTTTVVGVNTLHGSASTVQRTMVGPYLRLGMGTWGILAEHDFTNRSLTASSTSFLQHASYAQLFFYPREWLLISAIGEQLQTQRPFQEHLVGGRFEVTSRFSNHITLGITSRFQENMISGQFAPSVALQLALKTVE
jgi:hypothetical protein